MADLEPAVQAGSAVERTGLGLLCGRVGGNDGSIVRVRGRDQGQELAFHRQSWVHALRRKCTGLHRCDQGAVPGC